MKTFLDVKVNYHPSDLRSNSPAIKQNSATETEQHGAVWDPSILNKTALRQETEAQAGHERWDFKD